MTANAYLDSLDIANRACVHLGVALIESIDEKSVRNRTISEVYDKLRQDELRRNTWVFAKRKVVLRAIDTNTRVLAPQQWNATNFYMPGSIVAYTNGTIWHSVMTDNVGNEPGVTDAWDSYFGPMSVHLWDNTLQYYPGELVYVPAGATNAAFPPPLPGQFVVYMRKTNAANLTPANATNTVDDPTAAASWSATQAYQLDDVVTYGGFTWRSVIPYNINITPAQAPDNYDPAQSYAINALVTALDGFIYVSTANGNQANDPLDPTNGKWVNTNIPYAWDRIPTIFGAAQAWFLIYAGLNNMSVDYLGLSLGTGPMGNSFNSNVFMLPAGFLREVRLYRQYSAPGTDRERLGNFITSMEPIILFPFCADVTNVRSMDPMFCEGLAGRVAFETCNLLTQSKGLKQTIASSYNKFMTEARVVNGIEVGPEEADEDTYISVRRTGFPWQVG